MESQLTQRGQCPNPAHQLEPRSTTPKHPSARTEAARQRYPWSLATCLRFQGCLRGLIYAPRTEPSASEFDPDFRGGANGKGYP